MEPAYGSVSERVVSEHGEARARGLSFPTRRLRKAILSIDSHLSRLFDHQLDISSMAGVGSHVAGAVSGPVIGNSSILKSSSHLRA